MQFLSRAEVRQIDQDAIEQLGIPGLLLMENAARGVCEQIQRTGPWQGISIVCGYGNNGGDGLAIARLLAAEGVQANVFLLRGGHVLSEDAEFNLQFLLRSGISVREISEPDELSFSRPLTKSDLLLDCLLGTGVRGVVRSPIREVIARINNSGATILAVDLPSGLDCDSGEPCGVCVRADQTVTFVARKNGFRNPQAAEWTGSVAVCHIGIPQNWLQNRAPSPLSD